MKALIKKAEAFCAEKNLRFTDARRFVLEIIASSDKPIGAYDVLHEMAKTIDRPKPPTAYRAIEFLQKHGFVHRIESLNAYVACHAGHKHNGSQFMVCDSCGRVEEVHLCSMPQSLKDQVDKTGFAPAFWNTEIHGQCAKCVD